MPYKSIQSGLGAVKKGQGWQLCVHIDFEDIDESNPDNKIEKIKACVQQVFGNDELSIDLFHFHDKEAADYDGVLFDGHAGRTHFGQEIVIHLPDPEFSMSTEKYKQKLLALWDLLQKNNVTLLYFYPVDEEALLVDGNLPSPFSFRAYANQEPHPISQVSFSLPELAGTRIEFKDSFSKSSEIVNSRLETILSAIKQKHAFMDKQAIYEDFLFDDARTKEVLKAISNQAYTENDMLSFEQLLAHYPLLNASQLSLDPLITELKDNLVASRLSDERIDTIVDALRAGYAEKIEAIEDAFAEEGSSFKKQNKLIAKSPAGMQQIYCQYKHYSDNLNRNVGLQSNILPDVVLLTQYKLDREKRGSSEYLSPFPFFSRLLGGWSKTKKFAAVDALIASIEQQEGAALAIEHLGPLREGRLGQLVQTLNLDLNQYIEPEKVLKTTPS